ncbi:hypothetical protein ACX9R5_06610 [Rathayibacter sp. CAU 1779]
MLSSIITLILVVAFVAAVIIVFVVQSRRIRTQRVVLADGTLSTADPVTGQLKGLPLDSIGTVVYLPERHTRLGEGANGIWTWGGILILDTNGKVVRHIVHIPGSELPLSTIYEQIPAPQHVEFEAAGTMPYRRSAFLRRFPHSLGGFQLRGAMWTSSVVVITLLIGVPIIVVIGALIGAILTALTE